MTGNGGEQMEPVRLAIQWKSNHCLWGYATEAEARSVAKNLNVPIHGPWHGTVERQGDLWWVRVD